MKNKIYGNFCSYGNQCIVKVTQKNNCQNELLKSKKFMKRCDKNGCEEYIHEVCYLYDTYKLNRVTIKAITPPPFCDCTGVLINSKSIETKSKQHYCPNHKYYHAPYLPYLPYSIQMKIMSFKQTKDVCEIESRYTDRGKYNDVNTVNQCKDLLHEIVNGQQCRNRGNCGGSCISKNDYEFGWILIQNVIRKNDSCYSLRDIKTKYHLWLEDVVYNEQHVNNDIELDSNIANKNIVTNLVIKWIDEQEDNYFLRPINNRNDDDDSDMYDSEDNSVNKFEDMQDNKVYESFNESKAISFVSQIFFWVLFPIKWGYSG